MAYKILYLEDDETISEVICEYLKIANYQVTHCLTGKEALESFEKDQYHLVILDIMVPDVDGMEVLKQIRKKNASVGIIMVSALGDEKTQLESFSLTCDDYIIKPISAILLLKRIETILRRTVSPHQQRLPGLTIDKEGYTFYEDGKKLPLTLTEYLLLEAFYENPHKVFTRNELLCRIYGEDYFGSDRVIDSHIKNLRKKVRRDVILTVVGLGYRWRDYEIK
ncbi:MAG: response regulator transcription factor [Tissierellia bacterium]|nr:response regulator transcription factor [Tissierellia bacterium]